ncbi:MAG: PAS domain-containing protein [Campylobacterota bacterium]
MAKTTGKEQKVGAKCVFTSSTDQNATIISINDEFAKISGYSKDEMLGENHNIVRHPDMPKIIFDIMWDKLKDNKKFVGIIKNRTKDNNYYWLVNEVSTLSKKDDGSKVYYAFKKAAPRRAVFHINSLYKKLLEQEKNGGLDASKVFLKDFLEFRHVTYDEYIETLLDAKGLLKGSFYMTRKIFS